MTCAEFQERLSRFTDGELSRWTRWKVQNHLHGCAECACLLQELEEVDLCLFSAVEAAPAPAYITESIMRRLPSMPPAWRPRRSVVRWTAGLAVAGLQVVAIYGAYWWGFARGSGTSLQPGSAASVGAPAPLGAASPRGERPAASAGTMPRLPLWSAPHRFAVPNPAAFAGSAAATPSSPLSQPRRGSSARPVFQTDGVR